METLNTTVENLINESKYHEACQLIQETFNLGFKTEFVRNGKHFDGDKDNRDIYKVTLSRGKRKYSFDFGQSINNSGFYAQYGKIKYPIDRQLLSKSEREIRMHVKSKYNSDFGSVKNDKIVRPIAPTLYDVLACLQKYDIGSLNDFCDAFGYDIDDESTKKIFDAVDNEYINLCSLFTDAEMEVLQLIS